MNTMPPENDMQMSTTEGATAHLYEPITTEGIGSMIQNAAVRNRHLHFQHLADRGIGIELLDLDRPFPDPDGGVYYGTQSHTTIDIPEYATYIEAHQRMWRAIGTLFTDQGGLSK